ncbi:MAG: hypothetical protein A3D31_11475 [Candidatus Fluviicola riflensis]|nr:MAG: hypothetical protein CHH17_15905 [Candidatus Fluviicola riflensis]OGS77610.1 MAG: hypothetical protein A3D31_11475 [Candidatus Fluviicola riflensis]OGS84193.1 MAG: hypothetical protein A3E30_12885 [Fluviicola sp. RIFCSPHIGHO2_12_FULL_43_24]OGS84676.1 MAG: hypothetical protein A2724_08410 [Fluviicola sp. RIFCSPHIGHO2_01_FULL_43_53]
MRSSIFAFPIKLIALRFGPYIKLVENKVKWNVAVRLRRMSKAIGFFVKESVNGVLRVGVQAAERTVVFKRLI